MSHYIDREVFHEELSICKRNGKLSVKAIKMFQKMCSHISRDFYFSDPMDKDDAEAHAMHDVWKYWENFKESNVVQLKFERQPILGEKVIVMIHQSDSDNIKLVYEASDVQDVENRKFLIDKTLNYTLANLMAIINEHDHAYLQMFLDKIKNKVTLMDKWNSDDLSTMSWVEVEQEIIETAVKVSVIPKDMEDMDMIPFEALESKTKVKKLPMIARNQKTDNTHYFKKPPNAFSYFTSMIRNAILKSINKLNPEALRNGNKVSLDGINSDNNGMFNL